MVMDLGVTYGIELWFGGHGVGMNPRVLLFHSAVFIVFNGWAIIPSLFLYLSCFLETEYPMCEMEGWLD
jgi:hypothetical protein